MATTPSTTLADPTRGLSMHIHRSALLPLLSLLLVTGCKVEEGVDTTIIQGQVQLTPTSAEEGADGGPAGPNDEGFIAMPPLTYRYMTVTGSARSSDCARGKMPVPASRMTSVPSSPRTSMQVVLPP